MKNKNGITLVALIITIIILLILAAVTINMLLGDNGLISKTKESVAKYKNAQELENSMLSQFETEMDNYLNGGSEKSITRKITTENVASHIGEYIDLGTNLINKTGTTHKADWRIFDADETGVYAILADYLPTAKVPTTMKVSEATNAKEVTTAKAGNGWTFGWTESGTGAVGNNVEVAGTLTTASNWNGLVSDTSPLKGHITGGPTYEQFAKSWNKVNSSVRTMNEATPTTYATSVTDNTGLYIIASESKAMYCWIASYYSDIYMLNIRANGTLNYCNYGLTYYIGARPLVHLTPDIEVEDQDENGVWRMVQ